MNKKRIQGIVICLCLGLAAFFAMWEGLPLAEMLFIPAVFLVAAAFPPTEMAFALIAFLAVGFGSLQTDFLPMAALAVVAAAYGYIIFRKVRRSLDALIGCCAASLLSVWAALFVEAALYGQEVIERLFTVNSTLLSVMENSYVAAGYSQETAQAVCAEFSASYSETVPGMLLTLAMAAGLMSFVIGSRIRKGKTHYRVPAFEMWRMPTGYLFGGALLFALAWGAEYAGVAGASSVKIAFEMLLLLTYSVQGLAVLWFFLKRTRLNTAMRILVLLVLVVIAGTFLFFIAVMEDFLQLRRRTPPGWKPGGPRAR